MRRGKHVGRFEDKVKVTNRQIGYGNRQFNRKATQEIVRMRDAQMCTEHLREFQMKDRNILGGENRELSTELKI